MWDGHVYPIAIGRHDHLPNLSRMSCFITSKMRNQNSLWAALTWRPSLRSVELNYVFCDSLLATVSSSVVLEIMSCHIIVLII